MYDSQRKIDLCVDEFGIYRQSNGDLTVDLLLEIAYCKNNIFLLCSCNEEVQSISGKEKKEKNEKILFIEILNTLADHYTGIVL